MDRKTYKQTDRQPNRQTFWYGKIDRRQGKAKETHYHRTHICTLEHIAEVKIKTQNIDNKNNNNNAGKKTL